MGPDFVQEEVSGDWKDTASAYGSHTHSKLFLIVPIPDPHKSGVFFKMAALRRDVVATIANPKVHVTIHEG